MDPPPPAADEAAAVARAVASRQREFALGRWCARRALAELGVSVESVPVGVRRAPVWPSGIVGSITHCAGFVGAAVARRAKLSGLGFDAERAEPLSEDIIRLVCTESEIQWLRAEHSSERDWPKVLFSAKEAIHKCIWPLCGETLDFLDVVVSIDVSAMTFSARESRSTPQTTIDFARLRGRIATTDQFVFTCAYARAELG